MVVFGSVMACVPPDWFLSVADYVCWCSRLGLIIGVTGTEAESGAVPDGLVAKTASG